MDNPRGMRRRDRTRVALVRPVEFVLRARRREERRVGAPPPLHRSLRLGGSTGRMMGDVVCLASPSHSSLEGSSPPPPLSCTDLWTGGWSDSSCRRSSRGRRRRGPCPLSRRDWRSRGGRRTPRGDAIVVGESAGRGAVPRVVILVSSSFLRGRRRTTTTTAITASRCPASFRGGGYDYQCTETGSC